TTYSQALSALPKPLAGEIGTSQGRILADTLDAALMARQAHAARVAARLIGESGDTALLTESSEPCSLVKALSCPDREVRYAALEATQKLARSWHFPGASQVPIALAWFIGTSGSPKAVVAARSQEEAGR